MKASKIGGDYDCQQEWPEGILLQCGGSGVVISADSYITAFFEAFPNDPSTFIRGEGKTIEEAELAAWNKYQNIINCKNHEFSRINDSTSALCSHCKLRLINYYPPLTCCAICNKANSSINLFDVIYCFEHYIEKFNELGLNKKFENIDNIFNLEEDNEVDFYYYSTYLFFKYYYDNILDNKSTEEFKIALELEKKEHEFYVFSRNAIFKTLRNNSEPQGFNYAFTLNSRRLVLESIIYDSALYNKFLESFWTNNEITFEKELLSFLLNFIDRYIDKMPNEPWAAIAKKRIEDA